MKKDFMFTSESVTEGHPDKVCDQISDAIIDHFLEQDPCSAVRAECAVATSVLFIASRFASRATVDFANTARRVIKEIGYEDRDFSYKTCSILTSLKELSQEEYSCFDDASLSDEDIERISVRNQATVFGFACNQTPSLMPMPIWLAQKLSRRLTLAMRQSILPFLAPDGKTQVGVEYRASKAHRIHTITVSTSLREPKKLERKKVEDDILEYVIKPAFAEAPIRPDSKTRIFVNPEGTLLLGGPAIHSGLTGRKNAVDTYGEYGRHSDSALSGKDPMRIDRVGPYAARYAAKNLVAAGLAEECEVQLSYSIGLSRPVSIQVDSFDTGKLPDKELATLIKKHFDFRLGGILKEFGLRTLPSKMKGGFYRKLAAHGHVGRMDMDLPWERTDKVDLLK